MALKESDRYDTDPTDGLRRDVVGKWCAEKHLRLRHYVDITKSTRRKYSSNAPSYVDLYCGTGRSRIRETGEVIDGSPLVAAEEASKHTPFAEIHIGDIAPGNVAACATRVRETVANVRTYEGAARETAKQVVSNLNPYGLHLAFLDPYNLGALPFSVLETLGKVKRMDLIMHISEMDLQRNIIGKGEVEKLNTFAPGWERHVDPSQPSHVVKRQVLEYWKSLLEQLDYKVSDNIERVTGSNNQPLYWLILAARHTVADGFWEQVSNVGPQSRFTF